MTEKYDVIEKIIPLLDFPEGFKEIETYLTSNSNLPGPRGNLTLAFKFADCFEKAAVSKALVDLLTGWVNISAEEAPANSPGEFLPFCGVLALGAHYCYAEEKVKEQSMTLLRKAMNDKRWRMREGAAMGFQRIAEKDFSSLKRYFEMWYSGSNCLEKRAMVAALAHPPLLGDKENVLFSLKISEAILEEVLSYEEAKRKSKDFAVLSKGLQYALSVFAAALPAEGFDLLKKYARLKDPELDKIIKSNLGKARLAKKYGRMADQVLEILNSEIRSP